MRKTTEVRNILNIRSRLDYSLSYTALLVSNQEGGLHSITLFQGNTQDSLESGSLRSSILDALGGQHDLRISFVE